MTRRSVRIYGAFGALALLAVAVPAGVSFAGTDRTPAARTPAAHTPADRAPADRAPADRAPADRPTADRAPADRPTAAAAVEGTVADGTQPKVPAALSPPAGHVVHAVLKARGVQVYGCKAGAWELIEPAASLTGVTVRPVKKVTALHFRGPSWQSVQDGSLLEGDATSVVRAPSDRAGSIPQLRITAKLTRGDGVFGSVTYIQRLDTVGGVAPVKACSGTATTAVPYRAVYRFFVARS